MLTDGGVYDNLGLETVWKRYDTVLVSDAGGKMQPEPEPETNWVHTHGARVGHHRQPGAQPAQAPADRFVRERNTQRHLLGHPHRHRRVRAAGRACPAPYERTLQLAEVPTRLERMPPRLQEQLINWGYAVCDAAVRRHVDGSLQAGAFPYPASGI